MDRTAEPEALVRGLAETPARIEAVVRKLSPAELVAAPGPGAWSANEILWHIRATADVYEKHIARIIHEDMPTWRHVSPRAQMRKVRYYELPFAESFAAFERQRAELLARLETLEPEDWERFALLRVAWMQDDWRLTLRERVSGMVEHEHVHCAEMEKLASR